MRIVVTWEGSLERQSVGTKRTLPVPPLLSEMNLASLLGCWSPYPSAVPRGCCSSSLCVVSVSYLLDHTQPVHQHVDVGLT